MREILFRGKGNRKYNSGGWYYGYLFKDSDGDYVITEIGFSRTVIPETVGQYTGLTDKNGVRVFEGDIVKALTRYGTEHQYDITYRAGTFWFGGWNWIEFLDRFQFPEVIGNVHDNPELLKGE